MAQSKVSRPLVHLDISLSPSADLQNGTTSLSIEPHRNEELHESSATPALDRVSANGPFIPKQQSSTEEQRQQSTQLEVQWSSQENLTEDQQSQSVVQFKEEPNEHEIRVNTPELLEQRQANERHERRRSRSRRRSTSRSPERRRRRRKERSESSEPSVSGENLVLRKVPSRKPRSERGRRRRSSKSADDGVEETSRKERKDEDAAIPGLEVDMPDVDESKWPTEKTAEDFGETIDYDDWLNGKRKAKEPARSPVLTRVTSTVGDWWRRQRLFTSLLILCCPLLLIYFTGSVETSIRLTLFFVRESVALTRYLSLIFYRLLRDASFVVDESFCDLADWLCSGSWKLLCDDRCTFSYKMARRRDYIYSF